MRRIITTLLGTALSLALSGGVALADPGRGAPGFSSPRHGNGGYDTRGTNHQAYPGYASGAPVYRGTVNPNHGYAGGGIVHVQPVVGGQYGSFGHRRGFIAGRHDHYRPGVAWIPGGWQWDGYRWVWVAGYYQNQLSPY